MFKDSLSLLFLQKLILSSRSGSLVRRISLLSFMAITLSVAVFFIVLFVMNGMNQNIRSRILALDPNLTAYAKKETSANSGEELKLRSEFQVAVKSKPEFKEATGLQFDSYDLIIRTVDGQFRGSQAIGYNQEGLQFWNQKLRELKSQENRGVLTDYDLHLELAADEIAIGIDMARTLGVLEGDIVTLIPAESLLLSTMEAPVFAKVTVKRILTTELYDLDSKLVFFNRELALLNFRRSLSKVSGYHFWLNQAYATGSFESRAKALQTELAKFGFDRIETWQEKNSDLFFALFMEKTMIGVFLGLAGLIASSSILTVLALLMSQKRMDIAIIKTLGLSSKKTLWLFTQMGLWISLSALALGSGIGIGVSYYLQYNPLQVLPQYYYDSSIPALVNPGFALLVIIGVSTLAFAGCFFPARTTLKIEPALLLKTKV